MKSTAAQMTSERHESARSRHPCLKGERCHINYRLAHPPWLYYTPKNRGLCRICIIAFNFVSNQGYKKGNPIGSLDHKTFFIGMAHVLATFSTGNKPCPSIAVKTTVMKVLNEVEKKPKLTKNHFRIVVNKLLKNSEVEPWEFSDDSFSVSSNQKQHQKRQQILQKQPSPPSGPQKGQRTKKQPEKQKSHQSHLGHFARTDKSSQGGYYIDSDEEEYDSDEEYDSTEEYEDKVVKGGNASLNPKYGAQQKKLRHCHSSSWGWEESDEDEDENDEETEKKEKEGQGDEMETDGEAGDEEAEERADEADEAGRSDEAIIGSDQNEKMDVASSDDNEGGFREMEYAEKVEDSKCIGERSHREKKAVSGEHNRGQRVQEIVGQLVATQVDLAVIQDVQARKIAQIRRLIAELASMDVVYPFTDADVVDSQTWN